jgi:metallophosphoesterase superfamily enzyme
MSMFISMVKGAPALLIRRERVLVIGDLHIGIDLKYRNSGILFQGATERMAEGLVKIYRDSGARSIVILGDVKNSIGYPGFAEFMELKKFFGALEGIDITVARGNHDGNLGRVFKNIGLDAEIKREILIGGISMLHGNAWPSEEAMMGRYLVTAHFHFAFDNYGVKERVWFVARSGRGIGKRYERFNKQIRLIVEPAFNELVPGTLIRKEMAHTIPEFRQRVFDWKSAVAYDLEMKKHSVEK